MTRRLYSQLTFSDLSGPDALKNIDLFTTQYIYTFNWLINIDASDEKKIYFFTDVNVPYNSDWETGTYTFKIKIYYPNTNIYLYATLHRVNSSGVIQESTSESTGIQLSSATTYQINFSSKDWSSGNVGDRFCVAIRLYNYDRFPQTTGIQLGYNTYIDVPFTIFTTIPISTVINAVSLLSAAEINGFVLYCESEINSVSSIDVLLGGTYLIETTINSISNISASSIDNQPNLNGTINAISDVSSDIQYLSYLESIVSSNSSIIDTNLSIELGLNGQIDLISSVNGLLNQFLSLETITNTTLLIEGLFDRQNALETIINAISNIPNTDFDIQYQPITTINSISNVSSILDIQQPLETTIAESSTVSASLVVSYSLESSINSISSVDADNSIILSLEGIVNSVSSIANATISFVDMLEIWRNVDGGSYEFLAFTPFDNPYYHDYYDLERYSTYCYIARKIVDQIPHDWSNIDCVVYSTGFINISSIINAISFTEATLNLDKEIETQVNTVSSVSALLNSIFGLEITIDANAGVEASLSNFTPLNATINAIADVFCDLDVQQLVAGIFEFASVSDADLSVILSIASQIDDTSSVTGTLERVYAIASAINSVSDITAFVYLDQNLEVIVSSESSVSALMITEFALNGQIDAISDVSAILVESLSLETAVNEESSVNNSELGITLVIAGTIDAIAYIYSDEFYKDITGKECICRDSTITKVVELISTITKEPEEISTVEKIVELESVIPNVGRSLC